ncbi:hypothetical protein [Roseovarius salis]|uniref:hypothetical protein n=1 Tax=Roseovarius salis TaxID=3376063 RepID=UPI0037CA1342
MSERIEVKAGERGRVWVFAVDLEPAGLDEFMRHDGRWPVQEALGAETLDPEHVEVFPVSDLEGLGLSGYLSEGHGIPEDQLSDMRARLDAQTGPVMVLTSRAFHGTGQTLTPRAPLRLLASFSEERPPVSFAPLPSGDATGKVSAESAGRALRGPRNWVVPLVIVAVVLAVALVLLLVSA